MVVAIAVGIAAQLASPDDALASLAAVPFGGAALVLGGVAGVVGAAAPLRQGTAVVVVDWAVAGVLVAAAVGLASGDLASAVEVLLLGTPAGVLLGGVGAAIGAAVTAVRRRRT